jgi:endoglucanase
MNRKIFIRTISVIVFFLYLTAGITVFSQNNPWIGQNIYGWNYTKADIDAEETTYNNRHIDIVEIWVWWTAPFSDLIEERNAIYSNGSLLELCFQPHDGTNTLTDAQILSGDWDLYLHQYAREIREWGKLIWLRPLHEMNGNWFGWSPGINGNTTASYIEAWRHIIDIFRLEGADNVRWIYSVNWQNSGSNTFLGQYPGDEYVDYMSIDGYNWGLGCNNWAHWQSFGETFSEAYNALKMKHKPIHISEIGSNECGGDKAGWITDAFNQIRFSGNYNQIQAVMV